MYRQFQRLQGEGHVRLTTKNCTTHRSDSFHGLDLGKPPFANSAVFFNIVLGGVGGSNPCSKILLQIIYYSKGLFGNIKLTDMKDFLRAKKSQIVDKIV